MIGHPGLDSDWINNLTPADDKKKKYGIPRVLQCLVLNRKFLPAGINKPEGMDPGVLEFDDVVMFIKQIDDALKATGRPYKIIVKPHPSSSYPENIRVLKKSGIKSFEISYEPFFELLPKSDLMISEFSTSIAFSVLANVPTIVLNSPLQDYVHNSWFKLKELYSGLRFFVDNPSNDLSRVVGYVVKEIFNNESASIDENEDIAHFRDFYEDQAIMRAISRTEFLLN